MRKMHFLSLVAILLVVCLALSACSSPSSQSSSSGSETAASRPDLDSPPPSDIGGYAHEIGDCKFYTEHNPEEWIVDGVFDFYGMVGFFGLTEYDEALAEMGGYTAETASGRTHMWTTLKNDGDVSEFHTFVCEFAGGEMLSVSYNNEAPNYETVQTASGMIVPYELLEVFLFTLESFDSGNDFIVGDVKALGLPDYFSITTN